MASSPHGCLLYRFRPERCGERETFASQEASLGDDAEASSVAATQLVKQDDDRRHASWWRTGAADASRWQFGTRLLQHPADSGGAIFSFGFGPVVHALEQYFDRVSDTVQRSSFDMQIVNRSGHIDRPERVPLVH